VSRVDVGTLQRLMARTWPGLEQDRLGQWELRAAGGFTGRANSALPVGDPGMGLDEALDRVQRWYRERGLAPRVQVPATLDGSPGPSDQVAELCERRGWAAEPWTLVMVRELSATGPSR
jgi:N-acetylglutamate synthase